LRAHTKLFRRIEDEAQLGVFLDDRDDVAADLQAEHRRFDELGVLEAVADDRRVVVRERHDGEQLRLRPGLEPEPIGLAEVEHLFDDLALLIDLDRVDAAVAALVLVLGDGALKRGVDIAETMLEDVGEADEHGETDAAKLQPIDELLEVDCLRDVTCRVHLDVARGIDREVAIRPAGHFIGFARVVHAPRMGGRGAGDRRRTAVGHRAHVVIMINGSCGAVHVSRVSDFHVAADRA
jgi:hypothetical protein